jgi:hypothetical protein
MDKELQVNDVVCFKNRASGTFFKAKVKEKMKDQLYKVEIIECDTPHFIGELKEIDFGATKTSSRIEFLSIEAFEDTLARYEAAKYFNCCLQAVDTNDKDWFNDSFAQYTLWKQKIREEGK